MQGGKNWILPKEMNANRFFWDSHWLQFCPSLYGAELREQGYGLGHGPRNFKDTNPLMSSLLVNFVRDGEAIL